MNWKFVPILNAESGCTLSNGCDRMVLASCDTREQAAVAIDRAIIDEQRRGGYPGKPNVLQVRPWFAHCLRERLSRRV